VTQGVGRVGSYEESYPRLFECAYRVAFWLLGNRHLAEEVAQESAVRAYVSWRRVRGYALPWVVRVATNVALDMGRAQRRNRGGELVDQETITSAVVDSNADVRISLSSALQRLPRRQREVIVLRYFLDLSEDDIAALLTMSAGTVKTHAHRGLHTLRGAINTEELNA